MKLRPLLFALLLGLSTSASAYKGSSHMTMSDAALNASDIAQNPQVMSDLGLPSFATKPVFPDIGLFSVPNTISGLIQNGAIFEDADIRGMHHFFNPVSGTSRYYTTFGLSASPDWALSASDDPSTIKYSFQAARQYQWQATANPLNDYYYRQQQFGLMFESLGHVLHHMQGMAQPQHVRDDKYGERA
jgi:hypothetical protein